MSVRPALDTLRELDNGNFLDKLALAIHEVSSGVRGLSKPGKIIVTFDFALLGNKHLTLPVMTIEADVATKPPKPDANKALFFFDDDDNPTTEQQRQPELGLSIAPANQNTRTA